MGVAGAIESTEAKKLFCDRCHDHAHCDVSKTARQLCKTDRTRGLRISKQPQGNTGGTAASEVHTWRHNQVVLLAAQSHVGQRVLFVCAERSEGGDVRHVVTAVCASQRFLCAVRRTTKQMHAGKRKSAKTPSESDRKDRKGAMGRKLFADALDAELLDAKGQLCCLHTHTLLRSSPPPSHNQTAHMLTRCNVSGTSVCRRRSERRDTRHTGVRPRDRTRHE